MSVFAALFGRPPSTSASAPGRVNLIGEHTDYNGGFVLPAVLPLRTHVRLGPRVDTAVRIWSDLLDSSAALEEYALGAEAPGRGWLDYVQGVTFLLRADGQVLHGFDATITSTVPPGAGLSSSAALEVALLRALRETFALHLDDIQIALLGQRVENAFVGAHVGVMDQMAASLGAPGGALFIDTRSLAHRRVPLPAEAGLLVVDSGLRHQHASGDYNTRRRECEQAASLLGVVQLRDMDEPDLWRLDALPEVLRRRARHVITENARVLAAVEALAAEDVRRLGELFSASHTSQRDDYAVSLPAIDLLVDLAEHDPDVYGARLTGGGWGGSIVVLTQRDRGQVVGGRLAEAYRAHTGRPARWLLLGTGA